MSFQQPFIVLVGSNLATVVPYALPAAAFSRLNDNRAHTSAHLAGPLCHAAAPRVTRTGPHAAGTADTDDYRVRPVFVIPPQWSEAVVRDHPSGRCALPPFFPSYIAPGLADANANVQARAVFVKQWWHQACTNAAGGHNWVRITPLAARHAGDQLLLNQHVAHVKGAILTVAGMGGPGLTTAAF